MQTFLPFHHKNTDWYNNRVGHEDEDEEEKLLKQAIALSLEEPNEEEDAQSIAHAIALSLEQDVTEFSISNIGNSSLAEVCLPSLI